MRVKYLKKKKEKKRNNEIIIFCWSAYIKQCFYVFFKHKNVNGVLLYMYMINIW